MVERAQKGTHWCDKDFRFESEDLPSLVQELAPKKSKCSVCDEEKHRDYREDKNCVHVSSVG